MVFRWCTNVPLRKQDPICVNWCEITITDCCGKTTYRNAFITSLNITENTVADIVVCGRTRWKIENESFNVLKNNGYHLEHSFGHGNNHLAELFATMNVLAFTFHEVCDAIIDVWKQARHRAGKRTSFFGEILIICKYHVFDSWQSLITSMISGNPPLPKTTSADP